MIELVYLDCIDRTTLVVILSYSSVRRYHWEKLSKGNVFAVVQKNKDPLL